jgi:hypothetical protein
VAKKTAKKVSKPTAKKPVSAKASKPAAKKAGAKAVKPAAKAKKAAAPAKKVSPKKPANTKASGPSKKAKTIKSNLVVAKGKTLVKKAPPKVGKPAKGGPKAPKAAPKPTVKPAAKKVATPAVKPVAPKKAEPVKKQELKVEKKEAPKKEAPKKETPKKAEPKPVAKASEPKEEAPKPEKKLTQAQIKAAAKKEREYKNSAEFRATLPVKKRYQEEIFEEYKPKKEVRTSKHIKFELEYFFNASNRLLYEFFSTASGLADWFADDVRINRDGTLGFMWEGNEQKAKLLFKKDGVMARYKWIDEPSDTYFEFRIVIDDLTGDVAMIITDFAEDEQSVEASKMLWDSQVNALKHAIGAY